MGNSKLSIHVTCLMPVIYRNDLPGEERGLISFIWEQNGSGALVRDEG